MSRLKLITILCSSFLTIGLYGQTNDRWYKVLVAENPVGYVFEQHSSDGTRESLLVEMNISIGRLGKNVTMKTKTIQTEEKGKLVDIRAEMDLSNQIKSKSVKVRNDKLILTSQGMTKKIPLKDDLTGAIQLKKRIFEKIREGWDPITYTTYSAELGMFMNGTLEFIGKEKITLKNEQYSAVVVEENIRELPYKKKKWYGLQGNLLKSVEPSPFGEMKVQWTTKEEALSAFANSVDLPEQQYESSMAVSNHRLSNPREISSIKLRIIQNRPEFGFPDFSGEYQRVVSKSREEVVLQIEKPKVTPSAKKAIDLKPYLEPNAFLDNSDKVLIRKTKEVIDQSTNDWEKVQSIVDWVRGNMSFDAGIALANSRECIRDLKGTCVSYAMLTTTMSKAAGIPARFLMGYVYIDGAWGGHAWSEVYIDGKWIPIDAAIPNSSGIADAARFYMVRSSLQNGMSSANIAGMQLYGNIDVEIKDYRIGKESFTASAEPYVVTNDVYNNPGLKFRMDKIPGFTFIDLDRFYPDKTILSQVNGKSKIEVQHWTFGTENATERGKKKVINQVESLKMPTKSKVGKYDLSLGEGEKRSIALLEDNPNSYFSIIVTGPNHKKNLELAIQAIQGESK